MSSSVAVFDDGLAHDWPRAPRNGDSRAFYPDQPLPTQFDAAQPWTQMPASQLASFDSPASTPFSAYHPTSSQIVPSASAPDYHQHRPQVPMQHYQQGTYASHERQQVTPAPYLPPSDHQAQPAPIDSSSPPPQYNRYSYDAPRSSFSGDQYSTSSSNVLYGSTSSGMQPAPGPSVTAGSTTYEQPHNDSSGGGASAGDPDYSYVQSNANSLAYSEPVAPQPQRPRADFTQVSDTCLNPNLSIITGFIAPTWSKILVTLLPFSSSFDPTNRFSAASHRQPPGKTTGQGNNTVLPC